MKPTDNNLRVLARVIKAGGVLRKGQEPYGTIRSLENRDLIVRVGINKWEVTTAGANAVEIWWRS